tara:strand:- start:3173 stop:3661 length:489 start_codon:yes stop_codon:yes gene_type:complete
MQFKKYTKQRSVSIQGLRSFKDTLPKNIKKVINKKGHVYSETLNNWKYLVGDNLFKICYPKSFKSSNRFGLSTLVIMVKRGHEVDLEYSKKQVMDKINGFFGYKVVEKLKFTSFENEKETLFKEDDQKLNVTNNKFQKKINDVKNEKIKKSLIELTKVFKEK